MRNRVRIAQCASIDCGCTFATRSKNSIQYCPACRKKRIRESQRSFKEAKRPKGYDLSHNPDFALGKKLDNAEFSVLHDAGPEEAAFRRGARLTTYEVHYLLKYESIAADSVLMHTETRRCHRVIRDARGHLRLDPPYAEENKT